MSRFTFVTLLLLSFCLTTVPLLAQPRSTIVLHKDKSIAGYIVASERDSIRFIPAQNAVSPAAIRALPTVVYARSEIRQIRYGGDGFNGLHLLTGAAVGTVVGVGMKLLLDKANEGEFLGELPGFLALIGSMAIGTLIGSVSAVSSSMPDIVLHPSQHRDYRILEAYVGRQEALHESIMTAHRVWSLAYALVPRLTVTAADHSKHDVFLIGLEDQQVLLLRYDWIEAVNSGQEAEFYFRYDDIVSITYAPPGVFGGSGWTWNPTDGKPDDLRPHALASRYPNVLVYAPTQAISSTP
jgi:hypothetical protein